MRDEQADMIGISENAVLALPAASRRGDMATPCGQPFVFEPFIYPGQYVKGVPPLP